VSILYAHGITVLSAELIFILVRSADILILLKSEEQRTGVERQRMKRGLLRSIVFDGLLFVPSSSALLILLSPLLLIRYSSQDAPTMAVNALIGVVSYGFPFTAVRRIVTIVALNTLREFANIVPNQISETQTNGVP
jgi:hypothetical protein